MQTLVFQIPPIEDYDKYFADKDRYEDSAPNAFAIGRKTICVTDGILNLSDSEIMAVLAHELGHPAYKHSSIQLLIGGGNIFISGCLLFIKLICYWNKKIWDGNSGCANWWTCNGIDMVMDEILYAISHVVDASK